MRGFYASPWRSAGAAQVLADLGDLLVSKHDTEVALGCYAESVRLAPGVADAWLKLGIARGEEGDIHAAIDPCGAAWILARGSGLSSGPGPYSHFEGWISSCYYVSLPDAVSDSGSHAGWLEFGETNLQLGNLECVEKIVQAREGRLVLFPSCLFHGTVPFSSDEVRTTIAFDVMLV